MTRPTIEIDVELAPDHLVIRWRDRRSEGAARFDHLPGTQPEWLGSADELLDGADRRSEGPILDAVARWGAETGHELGIWHDDSGVELLAT